MLVQLDQITDFHVLISEMILISARPENILRTTEKSLNEIYETVLVKLKEQQLFTGCVSSSLARYAE